MGCTVPITNIPGVVVNPNYIAASLKRKAAPQKNSLKICFAAFSYADLGRSKGYPQFIDAAALLVKSFKDLSFSVVSDIGKDDWRIPEALNNRISFHGPMETEELRQFFATQDVMVSPSRRFATSGRGFDGFPTGTAVEAALCGCAIVTSDELDQNRLYKDHEEILICPPESNEITAKLEPFLREPTKLAALAEAGRKRTAELYGPAHQLLPRTKLLRWLCQNSGVICD